MSELPAEITPDLSDRAERKRLLVLACSADRLAWRNALAKPASAGPGALAMREAMGVLDAVAWLIPGRIGRWLRRGNFVAQIVQSLGWLKLSR